MTAQFSEIELSNCRLCGSPAQIDKVEQGPPLFRACCSNPLCLSGGTSWLSSKDAAAHVWNIRFNVASSPAMKFTDALILFCLLTAGIGFVAMFFRTPPVQVFHSIFWLGIGVFSCWQQTKPRSAFFGRLGRFFKAIPSCWAESKEASK